MTPNASKQGKLDNLGAIFLFIGLPCMWGLGFQNDSPLSATRGLAPGGLGTCQGKEGKNTPKSKECPGKKQSREIQKARKRRSPKGPFRTKNSTESECSERRLIRLTS